MDIHAKLKELNITLPAAPAKGGIYSPCKEFGKNLVYVSGCGSTIGDDNPIGKVGQELTLEQGQAAARNAMLNVLAVVDANVGLDKVKSAVKILTFVASANDFCSQPAVANGGSQLLADLFGAENVPARSAIGVNVLPGNIPVETEAIFEIEE